MFTFEETHLVSFFKSKQKRQSTNENIICIIGELYNFGCRDFAFTFVIIVIFYRRLRRRLTHLRHPNTHVTYHVSRITCDASYVTCPMSNDMSDKKLHQGDKHKYTNTKRHCNLYTDSPNHVVSKNMAYAMKRYQSSMKL